MFTSEERERVRERVFAIARQDERISGGAVTGSRSVGAEDPWSDIDTAFGVVPGVGLETVLRDWTEVLERELQIAHRFDLRRGPTLYRVFLLSNSLELDISLTPAPEFGAHGPKFELLFGDSAEPAEAPMTPLDELVGFGWIYALTARAAIERGRVWAAEYWVSALRDQALTLACRRLDLPTDYARGFDGLPADILAPYEAALIGSLHADEHRRALRAATERFLSEVRQLEPRLAERLAIPLIDG